RWRAPRRAPAETCPLSLPDALPICGIDGLQGALLGGEDGLQGFRQVLQQMETVRNLRGVGRALACTLGIGARPIPRDDLHPGMRSEEHTSELQSLTNVVCRRLLAIP